MGTWGAGMQANDTALDAISDANENGNPVKYLADHIDEWLNNEDEYGNGQKSIMGIADYCLDRREKLSDDLITKVKIAIEQCKLTADSFVHVQERLDAIQRFEDRLNGKKVKKNDIAKDNEGLLSKINNIF
jgi:hypothetical protein